MSGQGASFSTGSAVIQQMNPVPNMMGMEPMAHKKSRKGLIAIVTIAAILLLTVFFWFLIYSLKWRWFMNATNQQVDTLKAFLVSLGIAVLIVIIIGLIMYFSASKC